MSASRFIENAVKHVHNTFDVSSYPIQSPERLAEYVSEHAPDRRYKLHLLAASSDFRSGIVRWRGARYYFYQDYTTKEVEVEYAGTR